MVAQKRKPEKNMWTQGKMSFPLPWRKKQKPKQDLHSFGINRKNQTSGVSNTPSLFLQNFQSSLIIEFKLFLFVGLMFKVFFLIP